LPAAWPAERITDRKTAIKRIWTVIQKLTEAEASAPQTCAEPEKPKAARKAKGGAAAPKGAPVPRIMTSTTIAS
jgi:hypothetical protein